MSYFGKQVGRAILANNVTPSATSSSPQLVPSSARKPVGSAQVGKPLSVSISVPPERVDERCPRCNGSLIEEDGFMRCSGHKGEHFCGRRWIRGGPRRWLDPGTLPFGVCNCCRPRLALVAAEVGAICPGSHVEYLILPEGVMPRSEAAPFDVCRCCLPPQPLMQVAHGLVCRNKPQQHYSVEPGPGGDEVNWLGSAPMLDQAAMTASIDAALRANQADLTLFGLFVPPGGS